VTYATESFALDAEILAVVDGWHRHARDFSERDFDDLALRLLDYQLHYNAPYARYCAGFGFSRNNLPRSWDDVPAVPAAAFKEAALATFDPAHAALAFETSGTTSGTGGRHFLETRALYDAVLLAGFERYVLDDGARLRYLNVVPNPAERPGSSLGYMMQQVSLHFGDAQTGWFVRGDDLFVEAFIADARTAAEDGTPVCVAATAFGLLNLLDELERRGIDLSLPPGSRMMETGGFKGRTRTVAREELYGRASRVFQLPIAAIFAEYGMTELTTQYYDAPLSRGAPENRRKIAPPWLRTRVVGPEGKTLPDGTVGALVHVDLANRSSCIAVATEDLGVRFPDGLVVIGREAGASLRGCSLDAETLLPR
jgi:Acyl-protein synthetase, LuxE